MSTSARSMQTVKPSFFHKLLVQTFNRIQHGRLVLIDGINRYTFGQGGEDGLTATIEVLDYRFYRSVITGGSIGAGESFIKGWWQCDQLMELIQIMIRNRDLIDDMDSSANRMANALLGFWHRKNKNTLKGSKKNILAHYDLDNSLFELFLDPSMQYSSAVYKDEAEDLNTAQQRKLRRIGDKLMLQPGMTVLEIGTGWGGLAEFLAREYQVQVTTTTISNEQYEYSQERIKQANLEGQVKLLKEDYRSLTGQYDRLVSIEMIEAVGEDYLATYMQKCASLLKTDGLALIQAITIEDARYESALKQVDFIKRFIFPGSFIPSVGAITACLKDTDLRLQDFEDIGLSYAFTLRDWRRNFLSRLEDVLSLGFDLKFIRMWLFYLCYCEAGFRERTISDAHVLMAKPDFIKPPCRTLERAEVLC